MKIVLLLALVAVAVAMPQADITIVRSENDNDGLGTYNWAYETSDGTKVDQQGALKAGPLEDGTNGEFQTMKGSYSSTSPDGRNIIVTYEADERGYRAKTVYA